MATKKGVVKKTSLDEFKRQWKVGKKAIKLDPDDELVGSTLTDGEKFIMLVSQSGKAVFFDEKEARSMGRAARGVKGINLAKDDQVISLLVPEKENTIFNVSENGYGKRTNVDDFRKTRRGAKGVIAMQTSDRNGLLIGANQVIEDQEIMLISNKGTLVRTKVDQINVIGRNTQGVTVIKLKDSEKLVGLASIIEDTDD